MTKFGIIHPEGPERAESARAVTGRRCHHSEVGFKTSWREAGRTGRKREYQKTIFWPKFGFLGPKKQLTFYA